MGTPHPFKTVSIHQTIISTVTDDGGPLTDIGDTDWEATASWPLGGGEPGSSANSVSWSGVASSCCCVEFLAFFLLLSTTAYISAIYQYRKEKAGLFIMQSTILCTPLETLYPLLSTNAEEAAPARMLFAFISFLFHCESNVHPYLESSPLLPHNGTSIGRFGTSHVVLC